MMTYPCPFCGAQATLVAGCPGCGRPPYPDAAEVLRLGTRAGELLAEVAAARARLDEARSVHSAAVQRLNAVRAQRNLLAARVSEAVRAATTPAVTAPPAPMLMSTFTAPAPGPVPQPLRSNLPEASPRTVQNLLFILGGLLLGSAAIVFAVVAWASFGVLGRAAILAAVTLVTLAVPLVALSRRLRATAETFAALGLLLLLLDGYAAWYVNLAGLADVSSPPAYSGGVFALTTAAGIGYAALTGLRAPRYAALLAVQPVLPLFAEGRGFGPAGWALTFIVLAAFDVLLARRGQVLAWAGAALAGCVSGLLTAVTVSTAADLPAVLRAGGVLVALAALVLFAGLARPATTQPAAGAATLLVALAAVRVVLQALPGAKAPSVAAVALLVALAALAVPPAVRAGTRAGAYVVAGLAAFAFTYAALFGAVGTAARALPAWQDGVAGTHRQFTWQISVALVLVGAACFALTRYRWLAAPVAVLVGFAVPAAFVVPLPVVSGVDAFVVACLVAAALLRDRRVAAALPLPVLHALLVGLDTPVATVVTAAALTGLCGLLAVRGGTPLITAPAIVTGLLALPLLCAAAARTVQAGPVHHVPLALGGALLGVVLATVAARAAGDKAGAAGLLGVALGGVALTVAAIAVSVADGGRVPLGAFAAAALLCTWFAAGPAAPASTRLAALPAVVPALTAAVSVVPGVSEVLLRPYLWLTAVWRGAPAGVGLAPSGQWLAGRIASFAAGPAAVTLALATVLAALAARRAGASWWAFAAPTGTLAVVLGLVAAGAPWPVVPAVTLTGGLLAGLAAAIAPPAPIAVWRRWNVGAVTCWIIGAAGFAGCLAAPAATLAGLGSIFVTGAVAGVAGRTQARRTIGWLVAAVSVGWVGFAAGRAAALPLRWCSFVVLAAAAVVLAAALLRRGRPERAAIETIAHATALVAFLLAAEDLPAMAGISSLWGVALALRAVLLAQFRTGFVIAAATAQLLAYWLVLDSRAVALLEAYTLPAAALALAAGWFAGRRQQLSSWAAYAPGLLAAMGPSLASVLVVQGEPTRRLILGAGALMVVVAGAVRRMQAPVVLGGGALVVIALHEIALYWDYLPRWAPLAVAGLVLVVLATTYERRLRDVRRLRAALGRMH